MNRPRWVAAVIAVAIAAGLVAAPSQPAVAAPTTASDTTAPDQRDALLGQGWQQSGDRLWTTVGDSYGFHVLAAEARTGYSWHTVATLAQPGLDTDQWIGNACVTASGRRAVVVYAPRTFTNRGDLFDRGGFTAVVDLDTGAVTPLPVHTSLAYFNPGCGSDEQAALTQATDDKTGVLVVDAATETLSPRVELPGQATSAVPSGKDIVVAGMGRLEKVTRDGKRSVLAATSGVAHRLRPDAGGGLVFSDDKGDVSRVQRVAGGATTTLATGKVGEIDTTAQGGQVFITGNAKVEKLPAQVRKLDVPAGSKTSTRGEAAIVDQQDPVASPNTPEGTPTKIQVRSAKTGKSVPFTVQPARSLATATAATQQPAATQGTVDDGSVCAVDRNDPRIQVYQPSPRQVEWAADRAVLNKLTITRPANWKGNGIQAYQPMDSSKFGYVYLNSDPMTVHVPAQVLLGVLGQESNLWQAKRHVLPGQTGNALVGNYYGVDYYNDTPDDDWTINWAKADCGYGVGQVTDGMRKSGHPSPSNPNDPPMDHDRQVAVATDYTANIAAALQILTFKWGQMKDAGMTLNNNDPNRIENWFYSLWAYNSGYHKPGEAGSNGAYGLGWLNNPVNPKYDPDRQPFGLNPHDFATPQKWPYPEKVIGFASNPPSGYDHPGSEVPFFRAATWPGGVDGPLNRVQAKPPVGQFCDDSNMCHPNGPLVTPTAPEVIGEPLSPCYHQNTAGQYDLKCYYHSSSTWKPDCPNTCGREFLRFYDSKQDKWSAEEPLRRDSAGNALNAPSYPPRCVTTGLPSDALLIDDVPIDVPPISNPDCGRVPSAGTFDLTYGSAAAKIDLHQVGGGYGAHFWWSETKQSGTPADNPLRITGTWTLNRKLTAPAKVYVHLPDHLADASVTYDIDTAWGVEHRTIHQKDAPGIAPDGNGGVVTTTSGNRWVYLGGFMYNNNVVPTVRLSNLNNIVPRTEMAFDAVVWTPLSANESPDDEIAALVNTRTHRCLVVKDNALDDMAFVVQRDCASSFTDDWTFKYKFDTPVPGTPSTEQNYQIVNRNSGKCLAVEKARVSQILTEAVQIGCDNPDYVTTWRYVFSNSGALESSLAPTYSPLVLVVVHDSMDEGAPLVLDENPDDASIPPLTRWWDAARI
jgi:hypothetical protein